MLVPPQEPDLISRYVDRRFEVILIIKFAHSILSTLEMLLAASVDGLHFLREVSSLGTVLFGVDTWSYGEYWMKPV